MYSIRNCTVYLLDDSAAGVTKNEVVDSITNENLNCEIKANVYYAREKLLDSLGREYISNSVIYCPYGDKIPCENYQLTNYHEEIK